MEQKKYTGIKVQSLNCWLWFETSKVKEEDNKFSGTDGWGPGGDYIESFSINDSLIEGRIQGQVLAYN